MLPDIVSVTIPVPQTKNLTFLSNGPVSGRTNYTIRANCAKTLSRLAIFRTKSTLLLQKNFSVHWLKWRAIFKGVEPYYFAGINIVCGHTDLRYGIDSLAAIIEHKYHMSLVVPNTLFLFCRRSALKIKGLLWEGLSADKSWYTAKDIPPILTFIWKHLFSLFDWHSICICFFNSIFSMQNYSCDSLPDK